MKICTTTFGRYSCRSQYFCVLNHRRKEREADIFITWNTCLMLHTKMLEIVFKWGTVKGKGGFQKN